MVKKSYKYLLSRNPLLVYAFVIFSVSASFANENTFEYDPSITGQIVPREESSITVEKEFLEIRFKQYPLQFKTVAEQTGMPGIKPTRAFVRAVYILRNPETTNRRLDLAFPILRTGPEEFYKTFMIQHGLVKNEDLPEEFRRGVRSEVKFNGRPIEHDYISFESLFQKERKTWVAGIRKWLEKYPYLEEYIDDPENKKEVEEIKYGLILQNRFGRDMRLYYDLVIKFNKDMKKQDDDLIDLVNMMMEMAKIHRHVDEWPLPVLSHIYSHLFPEEPDPVKEFIERWGAENKSISNYNGELYEVEKWGYYQQYRPIHWDFANLMRRIDFLIYSPVIKAGKTAELEVKFDHLVNGGMDSNNVMHQEFQYILKSSRKWDQFGPIHIHLWVPEFHALSLPMLYHGKEEEGYHYSLTMPVGSEIDENLHAGVAGHQEAFLRKHYPAEIDMEAFYKRYEENPDGPLAWCYLNALKEKFRSALDKPDSWETHQIDPDKWLKALSLKENSNNRKEKLQAIVTTIQEKMSKTIPPPETPEYESPGWLARFF